MSEQNSLNLENTSDISNVEKYKFEPIKGYPMLHWHGKRPFTSTQYYPAQRKEIYGDEINGWINKIFWGDNLQVMSHLLKEFRGKIKLVYIDPPYDSNADYKITIKSKVGTASSNHGAFEEKQYTDLWSNDEYLQFIYERVVLIRELLSEDGSLFLHCDYRKQHHLRCICEEVFGPENLVNEIIWKSTSFTGSSKTIANKFPVNHNTIFWFKKKDYIYNKQRMPYDEEYLERFKNPDNDPNGAWQSVSLKTYSQETFEKLKEDGALIYPKNEGAGWRYKFYLKDAKGKVSETLWTDLNMANSMAGERTGYPTQKPEKLLERIVKSVTNPGDIVFDCFMGSGTTQAVAFATGRKYIGADINLGAIQISTKRLLNLYKENSNFDLDSAELYPNLEIFNVNNYDIFRNPLEAKKLLLEAMEIDAISGSIYDGEKEGFMVKVMPVNRIATREDLNELIANFPYKIFEQRKEKEPQKPVESIMLICMGHEVDLKAHLEQECGYKLNVKVVDVLRDKSKIEFKRDSEALIRVSGGKLIIENFFPLNLMQKLSIQKEKVSEWRELVESVRIDWNYDGAAMEPKVLDFPQANEFVAGIYEIPKDAGTIKIKITDLLSESYEEIISHG